MNSKRIERYLLGEMADPERDEFEEHYFSCVECAEEMTLAVKFIENARRPLLRLDAERPLAGEKKSVEPAAAPPASVWWERWTLWMPKPALAGACLCLALALVWKTVPGEVPPEVTGSYFVTATRAGGGAPRKIQLLPGQQRVALLFNQTDTSIGQFDFVLENAEKRAVQQFRGDAPRDTNDIQVMIPVAGLPNGTYALRVKNAASHSEVAELPFELVNP